jgi:hypothetical protein
MMRRLANLRKMRMHLHQTVLASASLLPYLAAQ